MSSRDDLRRLVSSSDAADSDGEVPTDVVVVGPHYGTFGHKRSSSVGSGPAPIHGGNLGDAEAGGGRNGGDDSEARGPPPNKVAKTRQTVSALGYCVGAFAMGNALGWSSPALPRLESTESSPQLTPEQAGWVGSLVCLGALLQGPTTGYLMTRLGRRCVVVLACLPCLCGWLLIANATDVWMLYAGRLATGWSAGAFSVVAPIYIGEVAAPEIRGALGSFFQLMVVAGIFTMYAVGVHASWQNLALLGAVAPSVLILVAMLFLRDSPASYMARGRPELARKCLVWLRNSADIGEELYSIQRTVEEARRSSRSLRVTNVACAADPSIRRPVLLAVFLMCAQQLSGVNAVIVFAVDIFRDAGATSIEPSIAAVVVGAVLFASTALSSYVNNHTDRRRVLISTECVMSAALLAFGAYSYLQTYKPDAASSIGWLPLLSLAVFILSFSIGLGPLAWLMMGEILPARAIGPAGGLASVVNWSLAFLVTVCFTYLTAGLGTYGTYWLFACFCAASAVVTYKFLPETRGKTLREVQEAIRRG